MRLLILLSIVICVSFNSEIKAQSVILSESFETNGEGIRYSSNSGNSGINDFWGRTDLNPAPYHSQTIVSGSRDGSWYWAGEAASDVTLNGGADGFVALNSLNVAGYSSLDVQLAVGISRFGQNRWENDDFLLVEYNMDNSGWNTIGLFTGNNPTIGIGGQLRQDIDNDLNSFGPFGTEVTDTFSDFTFPIPVTGSSLEIRVRGRFLGSEEIGFDNIRIRGILSSNDAPVLASIEGSNISYDEGDPATQITNTITVADNDDTDLSSAIVQITGNYDGSEDQLLFTDQNGISGSYVGGILTLTGTSSLANYQTALRSIQYQNTDAIDPSTATRTITFRVNDGIDFSNAVIRNIQITAFLNAPTSLPFCESFETNGEGTRYGSNHNQSTCDFFEKDLTSNNGFGCHLEGITGADGNYVWATEDVFGATGGEGILQLAPLNITGQSNIQIDLKMGVSRDGETRWELVDYIFIEYQIDGGGYQTAGLLTGTLAFNGELAVDTDNNLATNGPFGTVMTDAMADLSFPVSGTGSLMDVRIRMKSTGTEEMSFDLLCITGTLTTNDAPVLASIEGSTLAYEEGDPATQISNTISVSDNDDTDLESATVEIFSNFDASEDQLLFTNQNGITGSFVGNTLTLTGTSSLANYETALRSVQYLNNDNVDPSTALRTIRFIVNDGTDDSNIQSRTISVTNPLNAPSTLPVCESFETNGEGTRYASNHFNTGSCEFFERSPAAGNACHLEVISGADGSFVWASEDATANSTTEGLLTLAPIDITGISDLELSIDMGVSRDGEGRWDSADRVYIEYQIDGGGYTLLGLFTGNDPVMGELALDTDNNEGTFGPFAAFLTDAMQTQTFSFTGSGSTLDVRIRVLSNGTEEMSFDKICIIAPCTDSAAPSITCPATQSRSLDSSCQYSMEDFTALATASDDCGPITITQTPAPGTTFNSIGNSTVTLTATDGAANSSQCTFTLSLSETTPPVITCPANITVNNDPGQCGASVSFASFVTDNCAGVSISYSHLPGSFFPVGTTTVIGTATDAAGNSVSCSFDITVNDTEAPAFTCPPNMTLNNDPSQCGAIVSYTMPMATDNCPSVSVVLDAGLGSGATFPIGITTETYTATDASGNSTSCSFTITVSDNENPSIVCPTNITVNNDPGACGAVLNFSVTGSDNCPGVSVSTSHSSGSLFPVGTTTVNSTATDVSGNTTSCSFNITVNDTEPPVLVCQNITAEIDPNTGTAEGNVFITGALVSQNDNCSTVGGVGVTGPNPYTCANLGTFQQTIFQDDPSGNQGSCTFTVTVIDPTSACNEPPAALCQNIFANANANCQANATAADFDGGSSDPDGDALTFSVFPAGPYPVGTTTVQLTVDDGTDQSTCTATITVNDVTPPVVNCPANISVNNDPGICGAEVNWPMVTASDNCAITMGGSIFTTDAGGNGQDGIMFNITASAGDITLDRFDLYFNTSISNLDIEIYYKAGSYVGFENNAADWTLLDTQIIPSVTSNAPINFDHADLEIPAGQTFGIYVTTTNSSSGALSYTNGNNTYNNGDLTIQSGVGKAYPFSSSFIPRTLNATIYYEIETELTPVPLGGLSNGSIFPVGSSSVSYSATDAAGNSSSCSFDVTVIDNEAPTIAVLPSQVIANYQLECDEDIQLLDYTGLALVEDNCPSLVVEQSPEIGTEFVPFDGQSLTITLTAIDAAGNSVSDSFDLVFDIMYILGTPCDDSDPETINDVYIEGCLCQGSKISIDDPCVCLNNATTQDDGQFSDLVTITSVPGDTWSLTGVNSYFQPSSPAPPATPIPYEIGDPFTPGLSDGIDNDGDGMIDEADENIYYTLAGIHIDDVGFSVTASNGLTELSTLNKCFYPIIPLAISGIVTFEDTPIDLTAPNSLILNGKTYLPAIGTGSYSLFDENGNLIEANISEIPGDLIIGNEYMLQITFDEDEITPVNLPEGSGTPGCLEDVLIEFKVLSKGCIPPNN